MSVKYDVCIIGSGPAAHTCAIYTSRANLSTVLFEGWMAGGIAAGGQLTTTSIIENFPGFPGGIDGNELCRRFREQSVEYGTTIISETVTHIENISSNDNVPLFKIITQDDTNSVFSKSVVIATGAVAKRLDIVGGDTYWNAGISACAVCDGAAPIFRKKPIAVIGGGDSAMEEALFLTKYASHVFVIVRSEKLVASKIMQKRVLEHPSIEILYNTNVLEARGNENGLLTHIITDNPRHIELQVNGLFYAIGHKPASDFVKGFVDLDKHGYIMTQPGSTKTNVTGVFAAGDVQDKRWRQAITAAGSGCIAALEVEEYLQHIHTICI